MKLSQQAIEDLKTTLAQEYDQHLVDELGDEGLNDLGNLFLHIMAASIKIRSRKKGDDIMK